MSILDKLLRAGEGKILRKLQGISDQVNALEAHFAELTDEELRGLTQEYRSRLADGETLDDLLPEAFAGDAAEAWCRDLPTPIGDHLASSAYRRRMIEVKLRRGLAALAKGATP